MHETMRLHPSYQLLLQQSHSWILIIGPIGCDRQSYYLPNSSAPSKNRLRHELFKWKARKNSHLSNRFVFTWGEHHDGSFKCLFRAAFEQVILSNLEDIKWLYLYINASDTYWAGVISHVPAAKEQSNTLVVQDWNQKLVVFVSSTFKVDFAFWLTFKNGCYAFVGSVTRLAYILANCGEQSLFKNPKRISFKLSQTRFTAILARLVVHKTQLWFLRLAEFIFWVKKIRKEKNIQANMLTRWAATTSSACRRLTRFRLPLPTEERPKFLFFKVFSATQ